VVPERVGPPVHTIDGIGELIERIEACDTLRDWSSLLNEYIGATARRSTAARNRASASTSPRSTVVHFSSTRRMERDTLGPRLVGLDPSGR
jgi:hypothetical protein